MFVKPRTAEWFLKFMGQPLPVTGAPDAATYAAVREQAQIIKNELLPYGAQDMIDIQSMIWVGYSEARDRIGRLDIKGQVELDIPDSLPGYEVRTQFSMVGESDEEYEMEDSERPLANPPHSLSQCADETGYAEADLRRWVKAIERKKQVIFYGPPGTGKTFIAERLARHLVGGGDGFTELVQFHPAYAYEDFMQGIRPFTTDDGTLSYDMVQGRFYTFCQQARQRTGTCVLIIDEINRANVAGVFGELMYLLEYRNKEIALAGGGRFSIPGNVRILATMNTADRSIALVDHALRRRFAFIHLPPNYDLLRHYHRDTGYDPTPLIRVLDRLNKQIGDPHYQLGTSFFMRPDIASQLEDIWRMEVEPYLEEYFFDQTSQIEAFRWQKIKREIGE
jgi:5-methylcytosine-specific restriction protein B